MFAMSSDGKPEGEEFDDHTWVRCLQCKADECSDCSPEFLTDACTSGAQTLPGLGWDEF